MDHLSILQDINTAMKFYDNGRESKIGIISELRGITNRIWNSDLDPEERMELIELIDNLMIRVEPHDYI